MGINNKDYRVEHRVFGKRPFYQKLKFISDKKSYFNCTSEVNTEGTPISATPTFSKTCCN